MLIPSSINLYLIKIPSLSRRVNANSQHHVRSRFDGDKLIKKGEC